MQKIIAIFFSVFLYAGLVQAQITIAGNVYGGGNAGNLGKGTTVTVRGGDIHNVYGGARRADVGGSSYVHIDGENSTSSYIVIDKVYGGNDIAGTVGTSENLPSSLTGVDENHIDTSWNAFVRVSTKTETTGEGAEAVTREADDAAKVYIGQVFAGGNGDYTYSEQKDNNKYDVTIGDNTIEDIVKPEMEKTYLEICGGSIVYVYGGGNNVTITDASVIYLNNPSKVINSISVPADEANMHPHADPSGEILTHDRFLYDMGINTGFSKPSSSEFQIGRMFGGNNKAEMAIRPLWNLKDGKVRNLYSGGNRGDMTSSEGLLLEIRKDATVVIDNVYGGCRMADVHPLRNGVDVLSNDIQLSETDEDGNPKYKFPAGLSARVLVRGGDINNVYGGNDITGRVYGGDAVGVYTSIRGDVYGGGNGSYPYTDNPQMIGDEIYGDLYYSVPAGKTSAQALMDFRPNAEQVSIRLKGDDAEHPTSIGGSVYCGGNSATLKTYKQKPLVELKIGSHIIVDNIFLGNNGENMIKYNEGEGGDEGVLRTLQRTDLTGDGTRYNSMDLTDATQFSDYMDGVAMTLMPSVVFDDKENKGDPDTYESYTAYVGSFFCGGNVGSMRVNDKTAISFESEIVIYNKVVGGCNNAFVDEAAGFNAEYKGGLLGTPDENGNKLELTFNGLKIEPKRWKDVDNKSLGLEWNTVSSSANTPVSPVTEGATAESPVTSTEDDLDRRLDGGNIYGGCFNSGIVNGNVIINVERTIFDRSVLFDQVEEDTNGEDKLYANDTYHITKRNSGVILSEQGMDVLGKALNIFGGGKGEHTEIWGSATINLKRGYVFQIFGGSEEGAIGKKNNENAYTYDPRYSTYVNLNGPIPGVAKADNMTENMAECEFLYGGGFLGPVAGNCIINLGNGRIFNSFAGACNADVLGHTETYIGTNGFPYVRDYVYGGNDLGGRILNTANFDARLRDDIVRSKVYNSDMLNASAYVEYVQGRVEKIFGGAYGVYKYKDPHFRAYFDEDGHAKAGYSKPFLGNAFINFRPVDSNNPLNTVGQIYGAGQGFLGEEEENLMQESSYILVDVPQTMTTYQGSAIFGAGESGGVGMGVDPVVAANPATAHKASAVIDLVRGQFGNVYGGSYQEGITRRTVINVPEGSTFRAKNIFGGAYGLYKEYACDVVESNVNWNSSDATVGGYRTGIYGGNNNCRRTLYTHVNINAPVYYDKDNGYYATVYGAGYGKETWAQYTEVNLNDGARIYEVYGGAQLGRVMNRKSAEAWKIHADAQASSEYAEAHAEWEADPEKDTKPEPQAPKSIVLALDGGYTDEGLASSFAAYKYNTNVRINRGASVCGYLYNGSLSGAYAYGGGLGAADIEHSGDVYGTTYIGLFGGEVIKDIYAAGTVGSVNNRYNISTDDFDRSFISSANAYIEGGSARNVYGGGWQGSVGYHNGTIDSSTADDILGETNVVIGKLDGTSFLDGIPAIERNAYGGGEGGAVFGTAHITLNNGFIGYRHFNTVPTTDTDLEYIQLGSEYYQEKLHDETWTGDGTNRLFDSGCIFGGGYIDNSSVDVTDVKMYGGYVRNALFGGGEIAAVGRGVIEATGQDNSVRTLKGIYKAGKTNVDLFDGQVHRNVFGGGRGYNNLGEGGTLYSDGYVFGQTEVHVHGGIIGTVKELTSENGNVFGGGDIGYVYSAYEQNGKLYVGVKDGERYDNNYGGYYYAYEMGSQAYQPQNFVYDEHDPKWVMDEDEYVLTEDCKVLIEPYCRVLSSVSINGHDYAAGDYVPISDLNTMGNKNSDSRWSSLDTKGIIIYNAVFAGGNTSSGSSAVYANTTTVFGNATASVHDAYHRDFITLGTGHNGGLYGDGNLTFVDGYRGLNITNYGTDYYTIAPEITIEEYNSLSQREADYYQLKYKCIKACIDKDGTTYHPEGAGSSKASTQTIDDLLTLFENVKDGDVPILLQNPTTGEWYPNPVYWEENGVCSIYAGRLMNTIQRADFCGVFGSRMVMQGAQDRVPEIVDNTNYTINRVREVSLNMQHSVISDDLVLKPGKVQAASPDEQDPEDYADVSRAIHGNYFGIYSVVNYLGALSSDVHFRPDGDRRLTNNSDTDTYGPTGDDDQTYYNWKKKHVNERKRNNGTSFNKVALASGVYLELTTEKSTGNGLNEKDWGYVTGVIELDLINVQPGIGGGFVYAKNVHREGTYHKQKHVTLTALNADAITQKDFTYNGELVPWETSGNFVHGTQVIIDDCYNVSGKYSGEDAVPAHYWFIKGSVYVYDQYISAYTGSPNAYSESVDIPLTITAGSHGTMKLLNVMPNKYAYYSASGVPLERGKKVIINDVTYYQNDPISYWDWYLLTKSEQNLFVDKTYVTIAECKIGDVTHPEGEVLLPEEYETLKAANPTVYHVAQAKDVDFDFVFRPSNNLSHDTGYMLTYKVNNPTDWNTWYTQVDGSPAGKTQNETAGYENGPTFHLSSGASGVFGQREYSASNIISKEVYDTYQSMVENYPAAVPDGQATFEAAYVVTREYASDDKRLHVGTAVPASEAASMSGYVAPAFISTRTIQLSKTEFIYVGSRMTEAEKTQYYNTYKDSNPSLATMINEDIVPAYYCTADGLYGGDYYEAGKNYRGLAVWSSMSKADREHFTFNYDAFDLLVDPDFSRNPDTGHIVYAEGQKYQYDAPEGTLEAAMANPAGYSLPRPIDYTVTYNGTETSEHNGVELVPQKEYSRAQFERLPNEKRHYSPIDVREAGSVYVVNRSFQIGNTPYAVGSTITASTYQTLGASEQENITILTFTSEQVGKTFYYCREEYKVNENTEGVNVSNATVSGSVTGTYGVDATVPVGLVITSENYNSLPNRQTNFLIHGIAPTETSTLFVSRQSDIFDLSKEKIITVVYQYDYEESDVSGAHVTPISERHVVNIHLQFKSGVPTLEDIKAPQTVLPGTFIGIREPHVTPGAYEVTGGGWKLFEKQSDAESHINGIDYTPNFDPLYWYQDGFYLAYYAKTYLGETYSNNVKISVANYHDLTKVMEDKEHHYYVDKENVRRNSKIYITDNSNGINQLKQLFDLSLLNESSPEVTDGVVTSGPLKDHAILNEHVKAGQDLEFILRTNIKHTGEWMPVGDDANCFAGNLHGDGYHIDGIDHSLFGNLCGSVYNLGVTGSFTSAGIADKGDGYVENCWINTSAESGFDANVKAVFGNPSTPSRRQTVNCYYPETKNYKTGDAIPVSERAFNNGTVAYNLNGFYLYKRYNDKKTASGEAYKYYTVNTDGTLSEPQTKYYASNPEYCSSGFAGAYLNGGYVEDRYADGDYRYADGAIPESEDPRRFTDSDNKTSFYPIWPDDYIYFGQMLTYGWNDMRSHEAVPSRIVKNSGRLQATDESNRVYRAPAYYQSKTMDVAHFNPSVDLVAYSKPLTPSDKNLNPAYPNMTAIDFAGHGDTEYRLGRNGQWFYQPLLDDSGIISVTNRDETPNLLVYAPSEEMNKKTFDVLSAYFVEPAYTDYYSESDAYRRVAAAPTWTVLGHLVQSDLTAMNDHLLVDKEDFNCPMSYTFTDSKRMWYQRVPDYFVSLTNGWTTVSLPFTAELISTQDKGEITHFFSGSASLDDSGTKIGHEYWLREYMGKMSETGDVFKASFGYPTTPGVNKTVGNTFLYDYYYSKNERLDENTDTYQTYYKTERLLSDYPLLTAAKPYLLGLPGKKYYEFDLSGEWSAEHTMTTAPAKLGIQTVSFVSESGITVGVSDDELTAATADGYSFMPNYMKKTIDGYLMNQEGNSFDATPDGGLQTVPFRPYFVSAAAGVKKLAARSIRFDSSGSDSFSSKDKYDSKPEDEVGEGTLLFTVRNRMITVESSLRHEADVRIVNASGVPVDAFSIQPGATVSTDMLTSGVYIIRAAGGKYQKKLIVR